MVIERHHIVITENGSLKRVQDFNGIGLKAETGSAVLAFGNFRSTWRVRDPKHVPSER